MTDRHGRGPPRLNILRKSAMGLGNMLMIRAAGKAVEVVSRPVFGRLEKNEYERTTKDVSMRYAA